MTTDIFELIQQKCPNGVPMIAVKDLGQFEHGVGLDKSMLRSEGSIPVIHYGEIYTTYNLKTDRTVSFLEAGTPVSVSARHGDVVVCLTETANLGFVGKAVAQICGVDVAVSGDAGVLHLNPDETDAVYVSHIMNTEWFQIQKEKCKRGTTVMHLAVSLWQKIKIPLPPLDVQREIVAILDKFDAYCNSMTAGLAGELEMRRKQYRYWANELITSGNVEMVSLGKLCSINKGQQINKADYEEGPYDVWNMGAEPSGTHVTYNRDVPTIVIAGHGNSVGTVNWVDKPFWAGGGCYYLDGFVPGLNDRYLFHAMKARERSLMGLASDGPIRDLYPRTIARAQVPVPVSVSGTGAWDAARQQTICDILDKLCELERELERELELRKKQYAYYRDMLLSFPEQKGA